MQFSFGLCSIVRFTMVEMSVQEERTRTSQFGRISDTRISNPFWTGQSGSPIECSARCDKVTNCVAVSYHRETLNCEVATASPTENVYATDTYWTTYIKGGCPAGWHQINSACYLILETRYSWNEAKVQCGEYGAVLAKIENQEENDLVALFVNGWFWIGANDQAQEGNWVWADDSEVVFTKWRPLEPSNTWGKEHCVYVAPDHGWNDNPCGKKVPSVCERNLLIL